MKESNILTGSVCLILMAGLSINQSCTNLSQRQINRKPNVVFIICDDLNDYEGAFGGHPQVKTPNIDSASKKTP